MVVRCASDGDFNKWMQSLETQVVENESATYVRPLLRPPQHKTKVSDIFKFNHPPCFVRLLFNLGYFNDKTGKPPNDTSCIKSISMCFGLYTKIAIQDHQCIGHTLILIVLTAIYLLVSI